MNATLNATLADLETIGLDDLNERAAMLTRVDRKYALDAATMDSYLLTALKRRRRFKVRARTYLSTGASFLEVKTRGPRGLTVKKRMSISWDEAGAPLAGERRSWVAGKVEHTGYAHLVPALEPILAGSYERNTLLLPGGAGRATVDTKLLCGSLRPGGAEVARPDLVIIETKSGATPSVVDHLLWEGGVRPVKISKYGTAMAAMHDLPANKWPRPPLRYFPESGEAPALAREAPLAMAA